MSKDNIDYGWKTGSAPCSCDYLIPNILRILAGLNLNRILDIGSGNGILVSKLNSEGYYCVGIDNDNKGIEISKINYPNLNFYNYGVQNNSSCLMSKEKGGFDAVISTEVVEHLFFPKKLIDFSKDVLLKEGYLIISTPYHGYLKNLILSIFNMWDHHHTALWDGGHIKFWSRKTLTQLIEHDGNFKVMNFYGAGRFPWLWKSMILVAKRV